MDEMMKAFEPAMEPVKTQIRFEILKERRIILKEMFEIGTLRREDYDTKLCDILHELEEIKSKTY